MDRNVPNIHAGQEPFQQNPSETVNPECNIFDGDDPCWAIAATQPTHRVVSGAGVQTGNGGGSSGTRLDDADTPFVPPVPESFQEARLNHSQVESLMLKFLLNRGTSTGREIAEQLALPFGPSERFLHGLKADRLVTFKSVAPLGDYVYELMELGSERARRYSKQSTYFGAAPVSLTDYVAGVQAQSVTRQHPKLDDLEKAFTDLVLSKEKLGQIGEALNAGLGFFIYGDPGNGKTSIAERVTKAYGESIWIPKAINVGGDIIRLYEPTNHTILPLPTGPGSLDPNQIDRRWVHIRRPTIVVGGELTMDLLEITTNPATGISEAPLQLKSNCGTLVIDDFGRQRISSNELLNRWIVPLEKRHDYLTLHNGRKFKVPFDQLIVFSTNLNPKDLLDEAFLRRIPYKIDVTDPSERDFRELFKRLTGELEMEYDDSCVDYLLEKYYKPSGRGMRYCHPRDLVNQIKNYCEFRDLPLAVSNKAIDAAVTNYFAMM